MQKTLQPIDDEIRAYNVDITIACSQKNEDIRFDEGRSEHSALKGILKKLTL